MYISTLVCLHKCGTIPSSVCTSAERAPWMAKLQVSVIDDCSVNDADMLQLVWEGRATH